MQMAGQVRANWVPTADLFGRRQLHRIAAGRGQPLGSDPRRRRQPDRRAQRPAARSRLRASRELACRLVRSRLGTYSFNTQREERVNQGGTGQSQRRDRAPAGTHDDPRRAGQRVTPALIARRTLLIGGDVYFEGHDSDSFDVNPDDRRERHQPAARARWRHLHAGRVFAQTEFDVNSRRWPLTGAVRAGFNRYHAEAADAPVVERPAAVAG